MPKYPQALFWTDFETTGLPEEGNGIIDFRGVHVLEVGVIITDFDLQPYSGYQEVLKLTQPGLEAIKANEYVRDMHLKNNLIKDSRSAVHSLQDIEDELLALIRETTTFDAGEFMIAGSGVAAFDHLLIKAKMPRLAKMFAYYPMDIGVIRRGSRILAGQAVVNPTVASFGESKTHRAYDDVQAHLEEAGVFREFFRGRVSG